VARRPLHFFVLCDCSGSMAADGKLQALNTAMRETIPHLIDVANQNPHAQVLVRVLRFSSGASWHVASPVAVEDFEWEDLQRPSGLTDLGAALDALGEQLESPPMEERALTPAAVLISDGMPTDDYEAAMERLLSRPWGSAAVRLAVGVGRDADVTALQRFMSDAELEPLSAHDPEQLVRAIRWASTRATHAASTAAPVPRFGPQALDTSDPDQMIWG
jgi:uncharacterized protein YegL